MKWWDDLWLNEGFARSMEYVGVHAVHPEWQYVCVDVKCSDSSNSGILHILCGTLIFFHFYSVGSLSVPDDEPCFEFGQFEKLSRDPHTHRDA